MWNKFKELNKVDIMQITMAGILLGVGILTNAYVKVGNFQIMTIPIYIAIGIILPLWLGAATALLIDLIGLVLKGQIGLWYWTFGLEPIMIIVIAFIFKYIFLLFKNKNSMVWFALAFTSAIIIGSIVVITMNYSDLDWHHKIHESDSKFEKRMIKRYGSLIGLLFVIAISTREIYLIYKKKSNDHRKMSLILVVLTSLIIDWFYHPWSVYHWELDVLNIPASNDLYTTHMITGIWASTFHISIGIPIVASILFVMNNISYNKKDRY